MPGTITSDQLLVSKADVYPDAAPNTVWASIGTFTTGPSVIDDFRIEGTNCIRGRLSANVRGWATVNLPNAARVWQVDIGAPDVFTDLTTAWGDATTNDTPPFPASEAIGDYFAVGWQIPMGGLVITVGTAGNATGTIVWEYYGPSGWTALADVTDGTNHFRTSGANTVSWTVPSNWTKFDLNSSGKLFWVRARLTAVYTTTNPIITQGFCTYASSALGFSTFVWFNCAAPPSSDTWANGGLRITATGDISPTLTGTWPNSGATNSRQWYVNGQDGLKQSGYLPYTVDPSVAGSLSLGTYVDTRIRRVGVGMGSVLAMATGNFNFYWDRVSIGTGLIVTDGTAGSPADLISVFNADHTVNVMWGVITRAAGIYLLNGKLYIGQDDQAALTYFKDLSQVIVFQNFPVRTDFYEIRVVGKSGALSTFELGNYASGVASGGCTIKGAPRTNSADPSPVFAVWSLNGSNAFARVNLYAGAFSEMYRMSLNANCVIRNCVFDNFGDITVNGATIVDSQFLNLRNSAPISATYALDVATTAPDIRRNTFVNCARAVRWNHASDPSGKIDDCAFTSGGTGHAIEFGSNTPGNGPEISLPGCTFSGYGATGTDNAAIFNNSGKLLKINLPAAATYKDGAGSSTQIIVPGATLSLSGLVPNSEVRIYNQTTGAELAGVENSGTTFSYPFTPAEPPVVAYIHIIKNDYEFLRFQDLTLSGNISLVVQQRFDRNYSNPP